MKRAMDKVGFELVRGAGGAVVNFISDIDPLVIAGSNSAVSFSGVYLRLDAEVESIDLLSANGDHFRAAIRSASPAIGQMHKSVAHAGRSRYWFRDIPKPVLNAGAKVTARVPDGEPIVIAQIWLAPVLAILTETDRVPTKLSSLRFLRDNGLPVGTVIDIGVQHQTQDLIDVFPDKKHILIEPVEEHYPQIEKNYAEIDHMLIRAAASDRNGMGEIDLKTLHPGAGRFTSSIVVEDKRPQGFIPVVGRRPIKEVTLDNLRATNDWETPFLLKIDVDGQELRILRGASETLTQVSCIVIEASIGNLVERAEFLQSVGFSLWDIVDIGYYRKNMFLADMIFLSKEAKKIPAFDPFRRSALDPRQIKTFLH